MGSRTMRLAHVNLVKNVRDTVRICLWSGPRNVSTALMYSFRQRDDTRVVDEPLYGHYLRVSGAAHPGCPELLEKLETDGEKVVRDLILGPCDRPVLFMKHMAHHLVEIDRAFLLKTVNVFLTRDPVQMLPSLVNQIPRPNLRDTGYATERAMFEDLRRVGHTPSVLDSRELLLDPRAVLRGLCEQIEIGFQESMLSWPDGPKPEDGAWAPYWYHNVHRSTGFQPYRDKTEPFPDKLKPLLAECLPHYRALSERAIKGRPEVASRP